MKRKAKIIMGSALGLAAILVTIDHTRDRLPAPTVTRDATRNAITIESTRDSGEAPRGLATKPPDAPGYP